MAFRVRGAAALVATAALVAGVLGTAVPAYAAPAAPSLISPTDTSSISDNPVFRWGAVSGATGYRLQFAANSAFTSATTIATVSTYATPTNEVPNGNIFWRVAAVDAAGPGAYSAAFVVTKVAGSAPDSLSPADGTVFTYPAQAPVLQWAPVSGVKSYKVEIDDEPTFTVPLTTSATTANTALAVTTKLILDKPYYWRVTGVTSAGIATSPTDGRSFQISWPDGAPTLLTPADTTATPVTDVVLTWEPVVGAASYELDVNTSQDFSGTVYAAGLSVRGTQYSPATTYPNATYYWRVRAVDTLGRKGPYSVVRTFQRDSAVGSVPTLLSPANAASTNEWSFSWTSVPNASSYEFQFSSNVGFSPFNTVWSCTTFHSTLSAYSGGGGATLPPYAGSATEKCIPPSSGTYYWRVRSIDNGPDGVQVAAWSQVRSVVFTSRALTSGTPPQLDLSAYLSPADCEAPACTEAPLSDTPRLAWTDVAGAAFYKVTIATDRKFTNIVRTYTTAGPSLTPRESLDDNATDKSYYWFVQPCLGGVITAPASCAPVDQTLQETNARAFRKLAPAVTLVGPAAGATSSEVVSLRWDRLWDADPAAIGAAGYRIQVAKDATFQNVVDTAVVDQTTYEAFSSTYADGTYYWRVQGTDGGQIGSAGKGMPWSAVRTFTKVSGKPTGLVADRLNQSAALPVLSWGSMPFVSGYKVEIYADDDTFSAKNLKLTTTATLPSLAPDTALPAGRYTWRVSKLDPNGNPGPWQTQTDLGDVPSFVVSADVSLLQSPADGVLLAGNSLLFRWSPVLGASSYLFEASTSSSFSATVDRQPSLPSTAWAPTKALPDATVIYWRVRANDGAGNILSTSETRTFTKSATAPKPVFSVVAGATLRPTYVVSFPAAVSGVSETAVTLKRTGGVVVPATMTCAAGDGSTTDCAGSTVRKVSLAVTGNVVPGDTYTIAVGGGITDAVGNDVTPASLASRALLKVEQNAGSAVFSTGWSAVATSTASGGSLLRTGTKGRTATWIFRGSSAKVGYVSGKNAGKLGVYVDGVLKLTVDQYSSTVAKRVASVSVTNGQHTLKVVALGTKSTSSTGYYVNVDTLATS